MKQRKCVLKNITINLVLVSADVGKEDAKPVLRGNGVSAGRKVSLDDVQDSKEGCLFKAIDLLELCIGESLENVCSWQDNLGPVSHDSRDDVPSRMGPCPPVLALQTHLFLLPLVVTGTRDVDEIHFQNHFYQYFRVRGISQFVYAGTS